MRVEIICQLIQVHFIASLHTQVSFRHKTEFNKNLGLLFVSHLSRVLQGIILSRKEKQTNKCMTLWRFVWCQSINFQALAKFICSGLVVSQTIQKQLEWLPGKVFSKFYFYLLFFNLQIWPANLTCKSDLQTQPADLTCSTWNLQIVPSGFINYCNPRCNPPFFCFLKWLYLYLFPFKPEPQCCCKVCAYKNGSWLDNSFFQISSLLIFFLAGEL